MQMKKFCCLLCCLALTLSVVSCSDQGSEKANQQKISTQKQTAPTPQAVVEKPSLSGKVTETFNSGGYTYVRLDSSMGEKWVAIAQTDVAVGEEVSFADGQVMKNFHSKSLDRTFDEIIFSAGIIGKDSTPGSAGMGASSFAEAIKGSGSSMGQATPSGSTKAIVPFADLKIEKAAGENSYSVGDIYEKAADLDTKKVLVKGQVMKVSLNIMGKNWLHLQDGTGDPAKSSHDLVVTTKSELVPDKGDIVTIEGTLAANKDFGFGYKYAVIVEDAEVTR